MYYQTHIYENIRNTLAVLKQINFALIENYRKKFS